MSISTYLTEAELAYILADSRASAIVSSPDFAQTVIRAVEHPPRCRVRLATKAGAEGFSDVGYPFSYPDPPGSSGSRRLEGLIGMRLGRDDLLHQPVEEQPSVVGTAVVEAEGVGSGRGAVSAFRLVRFPDPPTEPLTLDST